MIRDREMDIWHLEAQAKIQKMFEEWNKQRLGKRAERTVPAQQPQTPPTEVPNA